MARGEGGRLVYADLLRVAATLAVVILHLSGGWISEVPVASGAWRVFNVYDGLTRWCVPVFVMLSGMFLLDPKKSLSYRSLFFRQILRIVVALVVWSVVYGLFALFLNGTPLTLSALMQILRELVWGKLHYHLWFLPMIVGLYLVTPFLRAFVRGASRSDFHFFFLLVCVFAMLLPTLLRIRPSATLSTWMDKLQLELVLGYTGYYVLGYYLKTYTLGRITELLLYLLGLLGGAVTVWGTEWLSLRSGSSDFTLYSYFSPTVCAMAVAVFVLFRYLLGMSDERSRRQQMAGLSAITFGIYLCHDLFIMLLRHLGISTLSFAPVAAVPALSLLVFLCAAVLAWLLSKIPAVGRFIT